MSDPVELTPTTAHVLEERLSTLPGDLPRYVVENYLVAAVDALLNVREQTNG